MKISCYLSLCLILLLLTQCTPPQNSGKAVPVLLTSAATLVSDTPESETPTALVRSPVPNSTPGRINRIPPVVEYENFVVGARLTYSDSFQITEPEYLFPEYGFILSDATKQLVLSVDWLYQSTPDQMSATAHRVAYEDFPGIPIEQSNIQIDGQPAIALSNVPGIVPNNWIYVAANGRLYRLIYGHEKLDTLGETLLKSLHFVPATKSIESLGLTKAEDALHLTPPSNVNIPPPDHFETPTGTQVPTPAPTTSSVLWTADFTPTVSIAAMGNATHEEIIRTLYTQYLEHYMNSHADDRWRLDDYEIHNVDASKLVEAHLNSGAFDFVAAVSYSVKPSVFLYSHWNAGSAQTGDNGWVNTGTLVGVFIKNGAYHLVRTGY